MSAVTIPFTFKSPANTSAPLAKEQTPPSTTLPLSPSSVPNPEPRPLNRPWSPSDRDRLIFQWCKFEGQSQFWVAQQLNLHQSTVSRILDRYERWIARGGPRQLGSPSYDEKLRAQRWLTYERNEWILTSALRIAGEMERCTELSKTTTSRPMSSPSQESEVRTENRVLDRSGIAARFLRLAYRVNMDQLQLMEEEPLPDLEPLTIDQAFDESADALEAPPSDESAATPVVAGSPDPATAADSMHAVHNPDTDESNTTDDPPSPCAENDSSEKSSARAYAVAFSPPEPAEPPSQPFSASPPINVHAPPCSACEPPTDD